MKNKIKLLIFNISFSSIFFSPILYANGQNFTDTKQAIIPKGLENIWDSSKYISIDEIKPGMEAYCLTEYSIAGIEKFSLDVIDVVRDLEVGKNVILVKGTDERFIKTGPVAGCSGSPVYIEGRLAGALAYTWSYSTEPLYAATPIEDMLGIDQAKQKPTAKTVALEYDFTTPVNFTRVNSGYKKTLTKLTKTSSGLNPLPSPLFASGISTQIPELFKSITEPFGLMVVSGGGNSNTTEGKNSNIKLVPGASLGVPLVSGDIKLSTMGTVTEVIGDKVYGFGHMLLGFGNVNLPIATGKVHTIVSNLSSSFKMASVLDTVGTLKFDESTGVIGQIGEIPKTIPFKIKVDHCNDSQIRTYNCRIASNALVTPAYLEMALTGAATKSSDLPTEHTIEYQFDIGLGNGEVLSCNNISTDKKLNEVVGECVAVVTLIMDNPFKKIDVNSIDCKINIKPKNISSNIWSVDLSKSEVKAGETIDITVIVESYLGEKKKYKQSIKIPEDLKPDTYDLSISGSGGYEDFITKAAPHKFVAQNAPDLIDAINNLLSIERNKLYFVLVLPSSGITLEKAELPDLPATKTIILQDKKRGINVRPYQNWIEKKIDIDSVVANQKVMKITVVE